MPKSIIRNEKGEPFSKWKPANKFHYVLAENPDMLAHVVPEYEFHPERKWRLDFAWPTLLIGVEINGFGFGHQAQQCQADDNEKANAATDMGWRVYVFNSRQLGSRAGVDAAVEQVWRAMCGAIDYTGGTSETD